MYAIRSYYAFFAPLFVAAALSYPDSNDGIQVHEYALNRTFLPEVWATADRRPKVDSTI